MAINRFSADVDVNTCAEVLYQAGMGTLLRPGEVGLGLEQFASFISDIMTMPAPGRLRLYYTSERAALVEIDRLNSPEGPTPDVWDQVTINGVQCGNRCGGRAVFVALVFPYIVPRITPRSGEGQLSECTRVVYRDAAVASGRLTFEGS